MKITKYLHSCLLIEEENKAILIDPGQYTYDARLFPIDSIHHLDHILITHEHVDHYSLPFIKELVNRFPNLSVISNPSLISKLLEENIPTQSTLPDYISMEQIPHESIVIAPVPLNVQFTLFNKITHPGDSYRISRPAQVLALPIQAPWGSFAAALRLAAQLKPKYIIPIHDWHWKEEARKTFYQWASAYFQKLDMVFKEAETGIPIEV